jgi:anti-sigma factor RsiW
MKTHADEWIPAYHDGELRGDRLAWVEAHLAGCAACRAELEQLRRLSALLRSVPPLADQAVPGRFTGLAGLRLPPVGRPGWRRALETGWQAAPLVLVLVWAFAQAVLLASSLAISGGFGGLLPPASLPLPGSAFWELASRLAGLVLPGADLPAMSLPGVGWLDALAALIPWPGLGDSSFQLIYLNLALTLAIGVFLWGWLASWWIYRTRSTTWITYES